MSITQEERFLKALNFEYIKIDERTFEDFLIFAKRLSALFKYYNSAHEVEGDWSVFFTDELIALAQIAKFDTKKTESRFKHILRAAFLAHNIEAKRPVFRTLLAEVHVLMRQFDRWFLAAEQMKAPEETQNVLHQLLYQSISGKLGAAFGHLFALHRAAAEQNILAFPLQPAYDTFHPVWQFGNAQGSFLFYKNQELKEKTDVFTEKLSEIFYIFWESLLHLQQKVPTLIAESLQKNTHRPEIVLYMVFLKLYRYPQKKLNALTEKYLDFYYRKVLKMAPRPGKLPQVYLKLTPNPNRNRLKIAKGTRFVAGEDEHGAHLLYATDYDFWANHGKISRLHTMYLHNRPLRIRGNTQTLISNIYVADLPVLDQVGKPDGQKSFALFGEPQSDKSLGERSMQDADLGFAIASAALFLSEGQREIEIALTFSPPSFEAFEHFLEDLALATQNSPDTIFDKVFWDAFQIYVSTADEWLPIKRYAAKKDRHEIKICFDLAQDEPAVCGYKPEIHGGDFDTTLPVVKFLLHKDAFVYPYSLLKNLVLTQIAFRTRVSAVKNLLLHNHLGALSAQNPFLPFGPIATKGAYLLVGNGEIFHKPLDELSIHIEWFDLPAHRSGFFGHYRPYKLDIDNSSFEVALSILDKGRWKPAQLSVQQHFKLFRTLENGAHALPAGKGTLSNWTVISHIDTEKIKQKAAYEDISKPLNYSNILQRGLIKLTLTAPDEGFAYQIYPTALAEFLRKKATRGWFSRFGKPKAQQEEEPLPPYAPQIAQLSLSYASSSLIKVSDRAVNASQAHTGMFFHVHPFGHCRLFPDSGKQEVSLVADFCYEGALMIGLSGVSPSERVSVFFEMTDGFTGSSAEKPPPLVWSYLTQNEWKLLPAPSILRNTTQNFSKTGIIEFMLPSDLKRGNSLLEPDLYWLRVAVGQNSRYASRLVSADTQLTEAQMLPGKNADAYSGTPLPAHTIDRPLQNIAGLAKVVQPLASFGGKTAENKKDFYIRSSARLQHKNRPVTPQDYAQIVLEKFPEIFQVNCLPNMSGQQINSPGSVLLIVIPKGVQSADGRVPTASNALLQDIKAYLGGLISPFVRLEVRNPAYETVKVVASIKFMEGYAGGLYLQEVNKKINEYIRGGSLNKQNKIFFGKSLYAADVLNFLRSLSSVSFVTGLSLVQLVTDFGGKSRLIDTARDKDLHDKILASKPWSVLMPSTAHQIRIIDQKDVFLPTPAGVGALALGTDLVVR